MTGWGPKILVVCCPEAEATAREDGYEVADAPGQNRRRTQAWTWSSIARTNLCTTRTRPGRDLSVTWPSQGTFPGSHRSARGPALPARCSCPPFRLVPVGQADRLPDLVAELVRLKVDVIVAQFTPAALAAKAATTAIPIVMAPAGNPIETGLVANLARPGGNVTGVAGVASELGGKNVQLIREMMPSARRARPLTLTSDADPEEALRMEIFGAGE